MGGAGLRWAACLSQDPPSRNPSHQLPPARFISCNKSNHPQIHSPHHHPTPPNTKQTNSFHKLLLDASSRHHYNYTTTSIKRN